MGDHARVSYANARNLIYRLFLIDQDMVVLGQVRFPDDFMGDAADFLENLLASAKINDCCLVGHSDGGTIALLHRARFVVRAIVTIAAHVRRDELTYGQVLRHSKCIARVISQTG